MKRIITLLPLLMLMLISLSSCRQAKKGMINSLLTEMNKECPMPLEGGAMKITKYTYDANQELLEVYITLVDEEFADVVMNADDAGLEYLFTTFDDDTDDVYNSLDAIGIGLKYIVTDNSQGKTHGQERILIQDANKISQIKALGNDPKAEADKAVHFVVYDTKRRLPEGEFKDILLDDELVDSNVK